MKRENIPRSVLSLAAAMYRGLSSLRNVLYDYQVLKSYRSSLPVISVGNISVGGTGKTPFCIFLCALLREMGLRPVILSRGYGGQQKGPLLVSTDSDYRDVGDEPLLMARRTDRPVVVARRRAEGARFIENQQLGDVILLDDGFQHRALWRDCDIVLLNVDSDQARESVVENIQLPLGELREDRDAALKRAHIVVLSNRSTQELSSSLYESLQEHIPADCHQFRTQMSVGLPICASQKLEAPEQVTAFCAIAHPDAFFQTLESLNFEIVERKAFSDHHPFDAHELEAMYSDRKVVCSEKDAMRLPKQFRDQTYVLPIGVKLVEQDEFKSSIARRISKEPESRRETASQ